MKLNKMLALALSGVMAVSMLAGCNGATSDGDEGSSSSQVTVSDAAAVMNKAQSKVEFKADPTLSNVLDGALEKLTATEIKDANLSTSKVIRLNKSTLMDTVYNYVDANLPEKYEVQEGPFSFATGTDKEDTQTILFAMKSGAYDENAALVMVANEMNASSFVDTYTAGGKDYKAEYTGAVSIKNVTKTTEDGKTYSAYIVAVSVTQIPTEVNK